MAAVDESRQKTRLPRLGLAPVVVAGKPSGVARPSTRLAVYGSLRPDGVNASALAEVAGRGKKVWFTGRSKT